MTVLRLREHTRPCTYVFRPFRHPLLAAYVASCFFVTGCGETPAPVVPAYPSLPQTPGGPVFTDRAAELGIDFTHFNGMTGELYFCEMVGSGVALFDYDNDGDLDVYLAHGHLLGEGKTSDDAIFKWPSQAPPRDQLFRNDLQQQPR